MIIMEHTMEPSAMHVAGFLLGLVGLIMVIFGVFAYPVTEPYQTPNTIRKRNSQTTGDKVRGQKGNSPDRQLRSPKDTKWKRM